MRRRGGRQRQRRPLTLHVSALSNEEYDAFTTSLAEVTGRDDVEWDALSIGVREARGWLKGRYYGVDGAVIDQILRMFCPVLGSQDVLSAGQFFAALRLVSHVQNGALLDEQLVFVQANPERERKTPSPHKHPPPLPPRTPPVPSPNPFSARTHPNRAHSPPHAPPSNPFRRSSVPGPPPPPPHSSSSSSSSSSAPRHTTTTTTLTSPPLPPRKPPLPPPRHASLSHPTPSTSTHTPARLPLPHTTSPLIKHGLHAAQSTKDARDALKNIRRLEVIKSSAAGVDRDPGAPRPPSPPTSLYDIAHARVARTQSLHNPLTLPPQPDSPPSSPAPSPGLHTPPLARHLSLTRADLDRAARIRAERLRPTSPRSSTFEGLRATPGAFEGTAAAFESFRAKAEGRVWPRGYVKDAPLVSNHAGDGEGGVGQDGEGGRRAFGFGQDVGGGYDDEDEDEVDKRASEGWRPL